MDNEVDWPSGGAPTFFCSAEVSCRAALEPSSEDMPGKSAPARRMLFLPGRMLSKVALLLCMFCR